MMTGADLDFANVSPLEERSSPGSTATKHVHVVNCLERSDGLFVFTNHDHATQFLAAVLARGGDAVLTEEPVIDDPMTTRAVIEAETGQSPG
jgi:hypothetical protein